MKISYSPTTGGFYPAGDADCPADACTITAARHAALLAAQAEGGEIVPDKNGKPIIKTVTVRQTRAAIGNRIKANARVRIHAISPPWRQLNDLREPSPAGAARFAAIDALRAASDLIERDLAATATSALPDFPVSDHPLWPEEDS